ncbi:transposase [Pseudomonadota bacterium]
MRDHKRLPHTGWDCKCHIVIIPKKRKKQIYGFIRKHLGEMLHELANRKGVTIEDSYLMPDHIHICYVN